MHGNDENIRSGDYSHEWYKSAPPPAPPNPWALERRISLLEQSTQTIKDELTKINSNLSKLVWIVITAVVLAGLNIIFNGTGGA